MNSDHKSLKSVFETNKENPDDHQEDQKLRDLKRRFDQLNNNFLKNQKRLQTNQDKQLRELQDDYLDYSQMTPIESLEKQTEELNQSLQTLNAQGSQFHQKTDLQIDHLEEEHKSNVNEIADQCRGIVDRFGSNGDQKLKQFTQLLQKDNKEFHEKLDKEYQVIDTKLNHLKDQIDKERGETRKGLDNMKDNVQNNLQKIDEEIRINTQVRIETNRKIREMIDKIHCDLEKKVFMEQREREQSNNMLLNLLEESCNKIENFFAQSC